ncbi:uncharacterized protein LOC134253979 [Saccostrea cucullata]|uniref:uncharacterized protein LOC134253979 n=1 Tax=Saccostrea cuccullata TaxID=36930 RepID=UPI002ED5DDF1
MSHDPFASVGLCDVIKPQNQERKAGSEIAKSNLLHKRNKKLSEEYKQLLKKISEGLERHDQRLGSPRKSRQTQGQQTDSEDGETDSIRSLPVTGLEFSHLDEREKVLSNAKENLRRFGEIRPVTAISPRKFRQTQGQQTDSEDGETDSIRSLPVTGLEFSHLDEREKVFSNAKGLENSSQASLSPVEVTING